MENDEVIAALTAIYAELMSPHGHRSKRGVWIEEGPKAVDARRLLGKLAQHLGAMRSMELTVESKQPTPR